MPQKMQAPLRHRKSASPIEVRPGLLCLFKGNPHSHVMAIEAIERQTRTPSLVDRAFIRAGTYLQEIGTQGCALSTLVRGIRKLCRSLALFYLSGLAIIWLAIRFVGETNITTGFLAFLPPSIWFTPWILLGPPCLFFDRKCLVAMSALSLAFITFFIGFRFETHPDVGPDGVNQLTILSYNRGQHMNQSLQPFKVLTLPDVMVMQEAGNRAAGYLGSPDYSEFLYGASVGEHTILSRFPLQENQVIHAADSTSRVIAMRFVIDWNGRSVSIYSVHLLTPRDVLRSYSRGAFLWGILGVSGTPWAEKRRHYQQFWDNQIADAKKILEAAAGDSNPVILAGDFNSPSLGYIHRMITNDWNDAHEKAGSGFGFTFPGVTRNPLSLGGPWMRIDYIFFGDQWEAVSCVTEDDRPSQHRALAATLRLK